MSSKTRQQLETWLKTIHINDGSLVLDIGGSQNPVKGRLVGPGNETTYKILDLQAPHQTKATPDIIGDINSEYLMTTGSTAFCDEAFNVAFCLEVSEYLWNPVQAFKNIAAMLSEGGALFASFHLVYPVHNPIENDYLRYTENGVRKILGEAGFKIVNMQYRTAQHSNLLDTFHQAEGMRPAKENDSSIIGCLVSAVKL